MPTFDVAQALNQFRAALVTRDIVPPEPILADGRLHRCNAVGRHGRGDAAYLLHLDGIPAGGLENWRDGRRWERWRCDTVPVLTDTEHFALAERARAARAQRDHDEQHRHAKARATAARLWAASRPAPPDHPYLVRKGVQPLGLRVFKGALVVPVRDTAGALHSLQFISPTGIKRHLRGGRLRGLGFWIGSPPRCGETDNPILVAEGFATATSRFSTSFGTAARSPWTAAANRHSDCATVASPSGSWCSPKRCAGSSSARERCRGGAASLRAS